jgi:hypothetical protein
MNDQHINDQHINDPYINDQHDDQHEKELDPRLLDGEIRAALELHWAASDANDFETSNAFITRTQCWNIRSRASGLAAGQTYKGSGLLSRVTSALRCGELLAAAIFGSRNTS